MMAALPAVFEFDRYLGVFADMAASGSPAELHGHLIGRLAAGARFDHATWLNLAAELAEARHSANEAGRLLLIQLQDASLAQLAGSGFEFTLLLPDDSQPMLLRSEALGRWCQGFLGGFGLVPRESALSEEVEGVLADFAAIAQIEGEEEDSEQAETDFMELVEYVRMASLLVFSECQPAVRDDQPPAALH